MVEMRHRLWQWADNLAHFLYCPAMLGQRVARANRAHEIHLIPASLLGWVCDRFERSLGMTWDEIKQGR